jgi:CubicO group peptidase (beta-lactamase class C family)
MSGIMASEKRLHQSSEAKMGKVIAVCLVAFLFVTPAAPQFPTEQKRKNRPAASSISKKPGIDAGRIIRLQSRMQSFVNQGRAPGIVTLVAHKGSIVHLSAIGVQDLESGRPMMTDTIFQVASMTKPITAVGIMLLIEDGLLALTDPIQKFLPKFTDIQLIVSAADSTVGSGLSEVRKPSRAPTVRDLLTHTSGMGSGYPESIKDLFDKRDKTLAEAVDIFTRRPLEFEPGSQWGYSNMGIAVLGRIIEVVSGQKYQDFINERVFQPLKMKDSHFFVPEEKYNRIASIYILEGGKLKKSNLDIYHTGANYSSPEAGLYSTAPDLFRFYQMMLNGGTLDGQQILSRASVDLMTRVHTGDLEAGFSPGVGFGLGWSVVRNIEGMFRFNSIGTFSHGGLYKTYAFADPVKELIGIILLQRLSSDGDLADEINTFVAMSSLAVLN